jgi:hypothetical protein
LGISIPLCEALATRRRAAMQHDRPWAQDYDAPQLQTRRANRFSS